MIYVFDTSAFSALMRQDHNIQTRIEALQSDDRLAICTITRGEILYGLERLDQGRRRNALFAEATRLFDLLICLPITQNVGDHYAQIKREAERRGASLDENDLWIAAVFLNVEGILVTQDTDFSRVSGLQIQNWT